MYKKNRKEYLAKMFQKIYNKDNGLYKRWKRMKNRCEYSGYKGYHRYGGKGIIIEWKNYKEFRNDMYNSFLKHIKKHGYKNTVIDRIDSSKNYSKDNCRWATNKENQNNRSNNIVIKYKGEEIKLNDFCKRYNMTYSCVYSRLKNKWAIEKIINTPCKK